MFLSVAPASIQSLNSASGLSVLTAPNKRSVAVDSEKEKLEKLMKRMKGFDQTGKRQINMTSMATSRNRRGTRANTAAAAAKTG